MTIVISACEEPSAVSAAENQVITVTDCGKKGSPDCPMQRWMKATLQTYLTAGESNELAMALDKLASLQPVGYDGWAKKARAGAESARKGDLEGTRATCKSCHETHRKRYRRELRKQPLRL